MDAEKYLARIGVERSSRKADLDTLRLLQRAHLLSVPFENLDLHWERPIKLDRDLFYRKIVSDRRGGFCYELNGLFETLLNELGYETALVSARVFSGKDHGPEFDHAAIIVKIQDEQYLVDVGFGAFSAEPLPFVLGIEIDDANGTFLIRRRTDGYYEVLKREDGVWRSEYLFSDDDRSLDEFAEMCDHQQYAPESHFRKQKLCSIMTEGGRKTLTDKSFIITHNGEKKEKQLDSEAEFYDLLATEFGITR